MASNGQDTPLERVMEVLLGGAMLSIALSPVVFFLLSALALTLLLSYIYSTDLFENNYLSVFFFNPVLPVIAATGLLLLLLPSAAASPRTRKTAALALLWLSQCLNAPCVICVVVVLLSVLFSFSFGGLSGWDVTIFLFSVFTYNFFLLLFTLLVAEMVRTNDRPRELLHPLLLRLSPHDPSSSSSV